MNVKTCNEKLYAEKILFSNNVNDVTTSKNMEFKHLYYTFYVNYVIGFECIMQIIMPMKDGSAFFIGCIPQQEVNVNVLCEK